MYSIYIALLFYRKKIINMCDINTFYKKRDYKFIEIYNNRHNSLQEYVLFINYMR